MPVSSLKERILLCGCEDSQACPMHIAPPLRAPVLRSLSEAAEIHEHTYERVPNSERTDRLRFVCSRFECVCGDYYTV